MADIVDLYGELSKPDSELSKPAETIAVGDLSSAMKVVNPLTAFATEKNSCLERLREEDEAAIFVNLIWYHLYGFFKNHIIENWDEVIVNIARGGFSGCAAKLHSFFNSEQFSMYVKCLFSVSEVSPPHMAIATELALTLYEKFLGCLVDKSLKCTEADEGTHFQVAEMSGPGQAKVKHVGGWAVRKLLENEMKYEKDHMHSKDEQTLQKVAECVANCDLIEDTLLVPYSRLETTTSYPQTLAITEARQF